MKCPDCDQPLAPVDLDDALRGASCPGCSGHWIAASNYQRWLDSKGEIDPELPPEEGFDAPGDGEEKAVIVPIDLHSNLYRNYAVLAMALQILCGKIGE